jgi:hypothetical protein
MLVFYFENALAYYNSGAVAVHLKVVGLARGKAPTSRTFFSEILPNAEICADLHAEILVVFAIDHPGESVHLKIVESRAIRFFPWNFFRNFSLKI